MFGLLTAREQLEQAVLSMWGCTTVVREQDREALKLNSTSVVSIIDDSYRLYLNGDLQESLADVINLRVNDIGETLLHLVCCSGDHETVKKLVGLGADVGILNNFTANCAHVVIFFGDSLSLKELIKAPRFNVNCEGFDTLVETAITARSLECLQTLIDEGADVNCSSFKGGSFSPLRRALLDLDSNIIKSLLDAGAEIDDGVKEEAEKITDEDVKSLLRTVSFRPR